MDLGLANKAVMVTGGTDGIGLGIARAFAGEGCRLAICGRNPERLQRAAHRLPLPSSALLAEQADMCLPQDIERFARLALATFGRIDVLVNCVGGVDQLLGFSELPDQDWMDSWNRNLLSAVRMTRWILPGMREAGWGRIINLGSESGVQPDPFMPHYNAAKAAIINFSKSLSKEVAADGILVNTLSPAMTRNPVLDGFFQQKAETEGISLPEAERRMVAQMRPGMLLGRPGEPAEVGAVAVFLASQQASFITGANIRVDGGSVMSQ